MGNFRTTRTTDQQLALEKKLGVALLAGLFTLFCMILSIRLGGFHWSEKKVEVNIGGAPTSSNGAAGSYTSSANPGSNSAMSAVSQEPYAPPQVYLPPAPPPIVGHYPLPARPIMPAIAIAPPKPVAPAVVERYPQQTIAVAPTTPPQVVAAVPAPPLAVIPATPSPRTPGVAAIGLVAGVEPITTNLTPAPASRAVSPSSSATKLHVFAEGENYWTIAQKAYGDGTLYRALFAYNQDRYPHPEDLRPGDKIDVPSEAELRSKFPQLCPPYGTVRTP